MGSIRHAVQNPGTQLTQYRRLWQRNREFSQADQSDCLGRKVHGISPRTATRSRPADFRGRMVEKGTGESVSVFCTIWHFIASLNECRWAGRKVRSAAQLPSYSPSLSVGFPQTRLPLSPPYRVLTRHGTLKSLAQSSLRELSTATLLPCSCIVPPEGPHHV